MPAHPNDAVFDLACKASAPEVFAWRLASSTEHRVTGRPPGVSQRAAKLTGPLPLCFASLSLEPALQRWQEHQLR